MLRSMTAYGRHSVTTDAGVFTWELRSVNNRYLETSVRLPEDMRELETKIRDVVSKRLSRGKIDVGLRRQNVHTADTTQLIVNESVLAALNDALTSVTNAVPTAAKPDSLALLQWPGVLMPAEQDTVMLQKTLMASLDEALSDFVATREREGEATAGMLQSRVDGIRTCVEQLRVHRPDVVDKQRAKLNAKLAELDIDADTQRLEQELVYVAQRLDIDEELDRLTHHLSEIESVLQRDDPVGRRLDFLMQELNREANTLGSKSSDVDTTGASVNIKVLIEQMREQIQNLE